MNLKKSVYEGSKRIFYLDALRVMAISCVILIHVYENMKIFILNEYTVPTFNWIITLILGSVPRIGVDLFLILSGALSLGRVWEIKPFLGKRLPRIIMPFAFWSIVLTIFLVVISPYFANITLPADVLTPGGFLAFFYDYIMVGKYSQQNWFFWMILGTYFIMPIFNKWILHADFSEIEYFLVFWLVTCLFDYTLMMPCPIKLSYFTSPIGLVVLGYYLRHTKRKLLNNPHFGLILIAISVIITGILGYQYSSPTEMFAFNRYSIICAITVIGVCIVFKNYDKLKIYGLTKKLNGSFISTVFENSVFSIAKYSYGIYLIHVIVLVLIKNPLLAFCNSYKISFIAIFVLCILCSWAVMAILNRVPYVNKVIGAK